MRFALSRAAGAACRETDKGESDMKTALLAATAIAAATFSAPMPAYAGNDPFVGEIMLFPVRYCPDGWVEADGRLLPIRNYQVLFTLLGNSYGGDGRTDFALPDLRKVIPAAATDPQKQLRYCIAVRGDYPRHP